MSCEQTMVLSTGATFLTVLKVPSAFPPGHFVGYVPTSQLRTIKGDLIADIACTWTDANHIALRLKAGPTAGWPTGRAHFDVCLQAPDGTRIYSRPMPLTIIEGITQEATHGE